MSSYIRSLAERARAASHAIAALDPSRRAALLSKMADAVDAGRTDILAANALDMQRANEAGTTGAMLDRLKLDDGRIGGIVQAIREIAALPDPVGQVTRSETHPNGMTVEKVRIPLGLIAMIYEARPNVTADAAALCLRAGNAVLLRGGSEARESNIAIARCLHSALREFDLPIEAVALVEDTAREHVLELLQLTDLVDLAIPRGGERLIRFVAENARVPVIKHYKGVCHLYVDAAADPVAATRLAVDGKLSRPGVCNALETLLVHADIAGKWLPAAMGTLVRGGAEIRGCERTRELFPDAKPATNEDYDTEYLAPIISVRVVDSIDDAIAHIQRHTSDHTEVISTTDQAAADRFVRAIRSSAVMVNASSRFNDGGQLGLGAEIGISTTRLHAYGPMGLESLTIERWVVRGDGQVRHPESAQA
ncbi:glutamate-5-semialdehyde dehydrogenase [Luteimonas soli]|uniref:Gamma-glutamyl phosphate reductase n=1 Tax=Luteimonas soli TaxID=1648966 RepID=A0ABV7XKE9_9GAMM